MTSSQTAILLRLVAFTLAAVTLWLAFSGAAVAAPAPAAFGETERSAPAVARNDVDRASDVENHNRDGIFAALLAALVAVLLGGGWLASAIARKLRTGTRS